MRRFLPSLAGAGAVAAALLFGPTSFAAAQISVPGDFGDLQDAIDAASPGEVIVIDGGTHGPIVIDKPLTLVGALGKPTTLTTWVLPNPPHQAPCVELAGPGSGRVTITNCVLEGTTYGGSFSKNAPAIEGGGFDELHVVHCFVEAPRWIEVTGGAAPEPGIEVDVAFTLIADSTVIGGFPDEYPAGTFPFPFPVGGSGIVSTGDVAVFDSQVRGGAGLSATWNVDERGAPPAICTVYGVGYGGLAVETEGALMVARSDLRPGEGGSFTAEQEDFGEWFVCQQGDGPVLAVDGAVHDFEGSSFLVSSGPLIPNQTFSLLWAADAPDSLLVLGVQPQAPLPVGTKGLLFADATSLQLFPAPGTGVQVFSASVPAVPGAEGLTAVIQRYSVSEGLSAPVFAAYLGN